MDIEALMEKPYCIIDILPKQVPANSEGQYFRVEHYYRQRYALLYRKFVDVLLKLNCYYDISVSSDGEKWEANPEPKKMKSYVEKCMLKEHRDSTLLVSLNVGEVLITLQRDDTYMTLYNPTEDVLDIVRVLASSEGLFVWNKRD